MSYSIYIFLPIYKLITLFRMYVMYYMLISIHEKRKNNDAKFETNTIIIMCPTNGLKIGNSLYYRYQQYFRRNKSTARQASFKDLHNYRYTLANKKQQLHSPNTINKLTKFGVKTCLVYFFDYTDELTAFSTGELSRIIWRRIISTSRHFFHSETIQSQAFDFCAMFGVSLLPFSIQ